MAKRVPNFTKTEEKILLELVYKYKDILECKKTDFMNNKMKWDTWATVAQEFNSISYENVREMRILKNKYENIKKRAKQKFVEYMKCPDGAGEGPLKIPEFTENEELLKELIGLQITGLQSQYDSDSINFQESQLPLKVDEVDMEQPSTSSQIIIPTQEMSDSNQLLLSTPSAQEENPSDEGSLSSPKTWNTYRPNTLKRKTHLNLGPKKNLSNTVAKWGNAKVSLVAEQIACVKRESDHKMLLAKEESDFKMNLAKEEHDLKMKHLKKMYELEENERILLLKYRKNELKLKNG